MIFGFMALLALALIGHFPIPEPPPVTTAILPEKSFIGFLPVL